MKLRTLATRRTRAELREHLRALFGAYEYIDEGCYGAVYGTRWPGRVLKMTFGPDKGYTRWLRYVLKHQGNPWVPRVYWAQRIMVEADDGNARFWMVAVVMERLQPFGSDEGTGRTSDVLWHCGALGTFVRACEQVGIPVGPHEQAIQNIFSDLRNRGCYSDIASRNVMMRGDQLVFTDPVCA